MAQEYINISEGSQYFYSSSYSLPSGSHKLLNFHSVKHLYYSNFNTGSGVIDVSGSYYNFVESSISSSRIMQLSGEGVVYSIPRELFSTHINLIVLQLLTVVIHLLMMEKVIFSTAVLK